MKNTESITKINSLIKDIRSCMFVTKGLNGEIKARPMSTQEVEFKDSIWFMTDKRSTKCKEIEKDNTVGLEYADGNGVTFVSVSGKASFVEDKQKIQEYWNPFLKAWFEGPEDPNIVLIEVSVTRAEYWDNKGGKIGGLADVAIGALTGKQNLLDEHEIFEFE